VNHVFIVVVLYRLVDFIQGIQGFLFIYSRFLYTDLSKIYPRNRPSKTNMKRYVTNTNVCLGVYRLYRWRWNGIKKGKVF